MCGYHQQSDTLSLLRAARDNHRKWVSEVLDNHMPDVPEDPEKCEFGKWMIAASEALKDLEEFQNLDTPHRQLHEAYTLIAKTPDILGLKPTLAQFSSQLQENIQKLEYVLERQSQRAKKTS